MTMSDAVGVSLSFMCVSFGVFICAMTVCMWQDFH